MWFPSYIILEVTGSARKLVVPLQQLVPEGILQAGEDMPVVHTYYGD